MKSYEIVVEVADELMFLRAPKAVDKDDAIRQVYDSDQVSGYDSEEIEITEVIEELEE